MSNTSNTITIAGWGKSKEGYYLIEKGGDTHYPLPYARFLRKQRRLVVTGADRSTRSTICKLLSPKEHRFL